MLVSAGEYPSYGSYWFQQGNTIVMVHIGVSTDGDSYMRTKSQVFD